MTDTLDSPRRPVPRWLHAWAILTVAVTLALLILGQLVTSFRAGMADPVWPTEPWYLASNYKLDLGYLIEHTHRIAGFTVGVVVAVLALGVWWTEPRRTARWVGLIEMFLLLGAFGEFHRALIAQRDPAANVTLPAGPLGVMGAAVVVVFAIGVAGAASRVRGSGLRLLAVVALVAVMVQGLLGGFRVRLNELVGTDLAAVHGVFAQVVFCLLVAVAELTRRPAPTELRGEERLRLARLSLALVGLLFVQLVWGVLVRHNPTPLSQRLHFLTAFLVVAVAVWLLRAAFTARARLGSAARLLGILVAVQILLGVEAWMMKFGTYTLPELVPVTRENAAVRTAHVLVGTGVLATAVVLALRVWVRERQPIGEPGDLRPPEVFLHPPGDLRPPEVFLHPPGDLRPPEVFLHPPGDLRPPARQVTGALADNGETT